MGGEIVVQDGEVDDAVPDEHHMDEIPDKKDGEQQVSGDDATGDIPDVEKNGHQAVDGDDQEGSADSPGQDRMGRWVRRGSGRRKFDDVPDARQLQPQNI